MNLKVKHLFFSMPTKTRIILRITAILIPCNGKLKKKIADLKGVNIESIFLGVGSDEPIDLLYRAFCEPGVDNVIAIDPDLRNVQSLR